ncbi:MAG: ATP-dependent Clp protease ATP-binding subunit, partial [Clostridia bacterium]
MLCQICKKNIAVVMVNIMKDGHNTQMALCLNCAQKQGITLQNLMNQSGLNEKDIENLNQQMTDMLENMDLENNPDALSQMMPPGLMEMLTGASPSGDQDDEEAGEDEDALMTMVDQQSASPQPTSGRTSQTPPKQRTEKLKNLMKFGINMTDQASKGQIDNIIGRDAEIQRLMQILNRRTKNNPILLGEPGVGKTAIAEGLALRIARRDVPVKLLDKEVF